MAMLDASFAPIWMTRIGVSGSDEVMRGVGMDSRGDPTAVGQLNGASTASTITPTTVATPAVGDPTLTAPGGTAASTVIKLPGSSGLFNPVTARTTGNAFTSSTSRLAINSRGVGPVQDLVSFGGEFSLAPLDFGSPTVPIAPTAAADAFLVFARLQP